MARLVVNPGSPGAWEIQLKPGANCIGRGSTNDFTVADPSVSTSHCRVVVGEDSTSIKDLGSTNGTFINRAGITEAQLESGQTIHLGAVEMVYYADAPNSAVGRSSAPLKARIVGPAAIRVQVAASADPPPVVIAQEPLVPPALSLPQPSAIASTGQTCKFHTRTAG